MCIVYGKWCVSVLGLFTLESVCFVVCVSVKCVHCGVCEHGKLCVCMTCVHGGVCVC